MKTLILMLVLALIVGCVPAKVATPVVPNGPDGECVNITLPCACGTVTVYVIGSCPCFDPDLNAPLAKALEKVRALTMFPISDKKIVGKYENILLDCGCTLKVYVPKSCGCLAKKYPQLEAALGEVYAIAMKSKAKD